MDDRRGALSPTEAASYTFHSMRSVRRLQAELRSANWRGVARLSTELLGAGSASFRLQQRVAVDRVSVSERARALALPLLDVLDDLGEHQPEVEELLTKLQ